MSPGGQIPFAGLLSVSCVISGAGGVCACIVYVRIFHSHFGKLKLKEERRKPNDVSNQLQMTLRIKLRIDLLFLVAGCRSNSATSVLSMWP